MESADVYSRLPHRYPFCLIDRVIEFKEGPDLSTRSGRRVKIIKNVTINENFFPGHFPGNPRMPGVIQIEVVAQAAAIAVYRENDGEQDFAIAAVNNAKFLRPVIPGDRLEVECLVKREKLKMLFIEGRTTVDGKVVNTMELVAYVSPKSKG